MNLFQTIPSGENPGDRTRPLADRMRPRTLDEFVGQEHLVGPSKPLRTQIERDDIGSLIFWGPPGTGKTTLAQIIARLTKAEFVEFSAVLTGIKERMNTMIHGDLKISRWLLAPEMLLCFAPLTLLWLDGIDGRSGLLRLNSAVIHKYFIDVPGGGTAFLITMFAGSALATIGPIALVAAFRMLLLRTPVKNAALRVALIAAPILYGLMSVTLRAVETGAATFDMASTDAFDFWSGIFLLSVLPALGAAHLLRLSPRPRPERIPG